MLKVPERGLAVGFAVAVKTTFEVPPLPLELMVSQGAAGSSEDAQRQAAGAVTVTLPVPPPKGTEALLEPRV